MFSMVLVGSGSVTFDTDPDSGFVHLLIRIRIQGNETDSTNPDPDPQHCVRLSEFGFVKEMCDARVFCMCIRIHFLGM